MLIPSKHQLGTYDSHSKLHLFNTCFKSIHGLCFLCNCVFRLKLLDHDFERIIFVFKTKHIETQILPRTGAEALAAMDLVNDPSKSHGSNSGLFHQGLVACSKDRKMRTIEE